VVVPNAFYESFFNKVVLNLAGIDDGILFV
jgi:hypothetical protein